MRHVVTVGPQRRGVRSRPGLAPLLKRAVSAALEYEEVDVPCEVHVLYTDNAGIRELNREFREIDRETDVLSFPLLDLRPGDRPQAGIDTVDPETGAVELGDMVLSLEKAESQAAEYGHSFQREAAFLAVHSVLHLLGYDHERSPQEDKLQTEKAEAVLASLELRRETND